MYGTFSRAIRLFRQAARQGRWLIFFVFLLALGLRLTQLNAASLWIDEIYSFVTANTHFAPSSLDRLPHPAAWYARQYLAWRPIRPEALIALLKANVHMPLYYLLLNPWLGLFGNDAIGLRSFSALCSALLVFPLSALGRAMAGKRAGIFVALAVALSPFQLYYGQEGRMYALLLLWASCSALGFWKVLHGRRPGLWSVFFALSLLGGFFTHYIFVFFLGFQALYGIMWLPWARKNAPADWQTRLFAVLWPVALLFLAMAGWLPVYRIQQQGLDSDYHFAKGLLAPLRYLTVLIWQPLTMASGDNPLQRLFYIPITLILSVWAFYRPLTAAKRPKEQETDSAHYFRSSSFLLSWVFVPLLLQVGYDLFKQTHSSVIDRYVLLISPAVCLMLGLGLSRCFVKRPRQAGVLLGLMICLAMAAVWSPSPFRDEHNKDKNIRAKMHQMAFMARPDDLIFVNGPWGAPCIAAYYLTREGPRLNPAQFGAPDPATLPMLYWISTYQGQRPPLPEPARLKPYRRVWLFRYRANNERGLQRAKDYLHSLYPRLIRVGDWFLYTS